MDKKQKLYDLYLKKGLISDATSLDVFSSATDEQQQKLYDLGKSNGLFNTTDIDTFKSAWVSEEPTEPTPEMMETGQREAAPEYAMTEDKFEAEKKKGWRIPFTRWCICRCG